MWESIKSHPVIAGAVALLLVVLFIRSRSTSAADSGVPEYSSGTTIVGTPNPLGGVQLAAGGGGAGGDGGIDSGAFFESQLKQAQSAQYASQTAALSGTNLEVLQSLLKRVGKGQDATFSYNALGQISGVDVQDNAKPVSDLRKTQEQIKIWTAKLKANLLAQKRGAALPFPDVGLGATSNVAAPSAAATVH
jgi:hypothetical protein